MDPRRQHGLPRGAGDPGRPGVDELLPHLSRGGGLRGLQGLRHRPGEPQDDARPLPADQEPAGQLRPEQARLVLIGPWTAPGVTSAPSASIVLAMEAFALEAVVERLTVRLE